MHNTTTSRVLEYAYYPKVVLATTRSMDTLLEYIMYNNIMIIYSTRVVKYACKIIIIILY